MLEVKFKQNVSGVIEERAGLAMLTVLPLERNLVKANTHIPEQCSCDERMMSQKKSFHERNSQRCFVSMTVQRIKC